MMLVHAAAILAFTGIRGSSSVDCGVLIVGSVVVVKIGRPTISKPGGGHIVVEAGPISAVGRGGVSFFRSVPGASAVPRLGG
ncbi:hypothetical protein Aglo03_07320 [Actinokineospora globicatena]|uniref:Uncharacterized protein n=1 Tax=Actinokineospora globicatena TaxID=103729 RepID=A0A9W6V8F2_9PSEU|nr:hypothetical protein Aglo03_07320 [Actinokineospora globicatena]